MHWVRIYTKNYFIDFHLITKKTPKFWGFSGSRSTIQPNQNSEKIFFKKAVNFYIHIEHFMSRKTPSLYFIENRSILFITYDANMKSAVKIIGGQSILLYQAHWKLIKQNIWNIHCFLKMNEISSGNAWLLADDGHFAICLMGHLHIWWNSCRICSIFLADDKFGETDESLREDSSKLNVTDTSHPWSV